MGSKLTVGELDPCLVGEDLLRPQVYLGEWEWKEFGADRFGRRLAGIHRLRQSGLQAGMPEAVDYQQTWFEWRVERKAQSG